LSSQKAGPAGEIVRFEIGKPPIGVYIIHILTSVMIPVNTDRLAESLIGLQYVLRSQPALLVSSFVAFTCTIGPGYFYFQYALIRLFDPSWTITDIIS